MTAPRRLAWLPMAMAAAALLSILAFLYARTQNLDEADYFEDVALLRHLKQLDAQWELDVLKSKIGINTHYDPLAGSLGEMGRLLETLEADMGTQTHEEAAALTQGRAALLRAIQGKAGLIEQFKSHNAVLRNSLTFLPTAAQDAQQPAGLPRESAAGVSRLLLASVLYSQRASAERGAEIQSELGRLEAGMHVLAPDTRERLVLFNAHVRTVLREQKIVNELLGDIASVPTAARIDAINDLLSTRQQRAAAQNQQYRGYLLIFSAVLVALLL
ncbi:MAG: histidine kinase, partial [Deltaproteobacteria bacterium]|nr:histidine kinase [Deltaproteobacteria bacterium]